MMAPFIRRSAAAAVTACLALALVATTAAPAQAEYSTSARETWSPNNSVFSITRVGDRVYIGGKFTNLRNVTTGQVVAQAKIAAFDATTGQLITSFNPSVEGDEVRAIDVSADQQTIYFAGDFTSVNNAGRERVAAVDRTGGLVPGWDVTASKRVKDLVRVGNDIYLAGVFGRVNGSVRGGLAKVSAANGQLDPDWRVSTSGGKPRSVFASPNGTDLLVGGTFTSLGGQPRAFLGSVTLATGVVTDWNPQPVCPDECGLFDVVADGDAVYGAVGGPGGYGTRWSATTGALAWARRGDGNAQAVGYYDGTLYVGGHFGPTFFNARRGSIAALNSTTGALLPWAPNLGTRYYPGVWAIDAGPDFLRIGGGFLSVNGVLQARYAELPTI